MSKKCYLDELLVLCEEFQFNFSYLMNVLNLTTKESIAFDDMDEALITLKKFYKDSEFLCSTLKESIDLIAYIRGSFRRHYEDYSIAFIEEKVELVEKNIRYSINQIHEFIK